MRTSQSCGHKYKVPIVASRRTFLSTIIPPAPRTTSVLHKSSSSYIRSSKKPWWSSSLTAARKTLKSTQRRWLKNKSDQNLFIKYKVAQRHFDKLVRNSKRSLIRKKRENLLRMLSKNQRKFWKTFDRISVASERAQKRGIPRQVRLHNGNLSNDPGVVKDSWLSFFKSIYAGTTDCSNPAGNPLVSQITPDYEVCLLYTSPSPRDRQKSRMPSSA